MSQVTATMLKAAVISYFRFQRQYAAIDEVSTSMGNSDVLCDNGKQIIEIEVKISKSDLFIGEKKKGKHPLGPPTEYVSTPNRFFICVPLELKDAAEEWIEKTHPGYGLLTFNEEYISIFKETPHVTWGHYLHLARSAKKLHGEYRENMFRKIVMRASASICAYLGKSSVQF